MYCRFSCKQSIISHSHDIKTVKLYKTCDSGMNSALTRHDSPQNRRLMTSLNPMNFNDKEYGVSYRIAIVINGQLIGRLSNKTSFTRVEYTMNDCMA